MLREQLPKGVCSTCRREGQRDFVTLYFLYSLWSTLGCSVQAKDNIERVKSVIQNFMIFIAVREV